ncbi:Gfo/Idh/MocA family oxidoreductase [Horticoccus luteus]|uniref:Gfo/Idh/MocA family oxidoreductase n=1 Tax=Horticoccus luteus TaxID=2862869 RepID=A0A8F9TVY0_9BACT|nr:Gfo/Idh/MocA family oxidoreductase [Horticoccus luteus]QYM79062.1 Gfo/Idh/MocA family oxidoreductase [Horticoccus luteus]
MSAPIKFGLIGLDTSHVLVFSDTFNNAEGKQFLPGARVVAAWPGGSPDLESSRSRVPGYTAEVRDKFGVEIADSIEDVVAASDAILLTSLDGRVHREQFARVAAAGPGKPVFLDKPFALTEADARAIFATAKAHDVPLFSSSSLRFTGALTRVVTAETKRTVRGADFHGPVALEPTNPGFFWYGIHAVEMLYATMGRGCGSVRCVTTEHYDLVTATWADGRIGTVRGNRTGNYEFHGLVHFEKHSAHVNVQTETKGFFTCLAEAVLEFVRTRQAPVDPEETIELVRFIVAANESRANGGREVTL